ncbi:SPOSA6832_02275 [Sporobolomyces salmonicolor]|uniref:SPOSA6832_02275-mRNA-1:cds n=1 Tax=Sporidiobolus salmonicolor TaxID=5005 RepID=A0A0D6EKT4_SPOSA|nr:SPOSA6832_02275 [Sporobolomyces salmonicolor]
MPRSPAAGPAPAQSEPDYFDSLVACAAHLAAPRPACRRHAPPHIPRVKPAALRKEGQEGGKLLVCHDYKAIVRRTMNEAIRSSIFISVTPSSSTLHPIFSHHRVSCPPPAWIRTAHRHGTRILGTLIFEWDAGRSDIVELVSPAGSSPSSTSPPFSQVDLRYADMLVDLAVERGFDGWLVNVEVELGLDEREAGGTKRRAKEHANALLVWLRYLRDEMHKRMPDAEVMWRVPRCSEVGAKQCTNASTSRYDAVITEGRSRLTNLLLDANAFLDTGRLEWQNCVNDLNLPFVSACDSIFLNYFWRPNDVAATATLLDQCDPSRKGDVYFGIDVFGRGSFGGGGFDSWRALDVIQAAPLAPLSAPPSSFSTALFAPGWTVESSDLRHSLDTPAAYARWWEDELYFWSNGPPTENVSLEAARMLKVRQEQRGIQRASELAAALAYNPLVPLPFRRPVEPLNFDCTAPLPALPGSFRPLCSALPSPRPPPSHNSTFYTNFAGGSGHAFFVEGEKTFSSEKGWTDVDFAFPFPSYVFQQPVGGVKAELVEDDAWEGPRALKLVVAEGVGAKGTTTIPLTALNMPVRPGHAFDASVVWKALGGDIEVVPDLHHTLLPAASSPSPPPALPSQANPLLSSAPDTIDLKHGWKRTSCAIRLDADAGPNTTILQYRIVVSGSPQATLLIGSLSVCPTANATLPPPIVANLKYDGPFSRLRWDVVRGVPPILRAPRSAASSSSSWTDPATWSSFVHFHVYLRRNEREEHLGSTLATEFAIERARITAAEVRVRGVRVDGSSGAGDVASFVEVQQRDRE